MWQQEFRPQKWSDLSGLWLGLAQLPILLLQPCAWSAQYLPLVPTLVSPESPINPNALINRETLYKPSRRKPWREKHGSGNWRLATNISIKDPNVHGTENLNHQTEMCRLLACLDDGSSAAWPDEHTGCTLFASCVAKLRLTADCWRAKTVADHL